MNYDLSCRFDFAWVVPQFYRQFFEFSSGWAKSEKSSNGVTGRWHAKLRVRRKRGERESMTAASAPYG
eukprot:2849354-Rhodomonas_salina.2